VRNLGREGAIGEGIKGKGGGARESAPALFEVQQLEKIFYALGGGAMQPRHLELAVHSEINLAPKCVAFLKNTRVSDYLQAVRATTTARALDCSCRAPRTTAQLSRP
jgi:hypothetical protein